LIALLLVFPLLPFSAHAAVITTDTTWSGTVSLAEDILVPEGVTLTIAAGTTVRVTPSESTRTDPEFLSPMTELTIRGTLVVSGKDDAQVTFSPEGGSKASWAGIIIDGGRGKVRSAVIKGAETGITVIKGSLVLVRSTLNGNRYGLTAHSRDSVVRLESSRVTENEYGVFLLNGRVSRAGRRSRRTAERTGIPPGRGRTARLRGPKTGPNDAGRVFGDEVILGTVVWQKRIEVRGTVRVPEGSRLVILPGTTVEFTRKDTNSDTIGENGLLIQGSIIAKGTEGSPIIFRSAEKQRRMRLGFDQYHEQRPVPEPR
jgi:hypothetical protein